MGRLRGKAATSGTPASAQAVVDRAGVAFPVARCGQSRPKAFRVQGRLPDRRMNSGAFAPVPCSPTAASGTRPVRVDNGLQAGTCRGGTAWQPCRAMGRVCDQLRFLPDGSRCRSHEIGFPDIDGMPGKGVLSSGDQVRCPEFRRHVGNLARQFVAAVAIGGTLVRIR